MLRIAEYNTITGEEIELSSLNLFGFMKIDKTAYVRCSVYDSQAISISIKTRNISYDKGSFARGIIKDLKKAGLVEKLED